MNAFDVLEFLKANQDKKYKSYVLAQKFNVSTQTMTMTLIALGDQIQSEISGKSRDFWVMSDEVRKQRQERQDQMQAQIDKRKSVYQLPQATADALARAREGRDPDFGYITIS